METLQKFNDIANRISESNQYTSKTLIANCNKLMEKFVNYEEVLFFFDPST
jgi:hypothetical protein